VPDDAVRSTLETVQDILARGVFGSVNFVLLSRERIQEAFDDAVERGRVTRDDANDLVTALVSTGRQQAQDFVSDVEQILGRNAAGTTDRVLREVDRARRTAGIGPAFPISNYDDLTAAQVTARVNDLTPAELRKVRDHERRNANRKSVLSAIERKLA
jgi:polyhydroxyalkanoate synthesis regulator phasin